MVFDRLRARRSGKRLKGGDVPAPRPQRQRTTVHGHPDPIARREDYRDVVDGAGASVPMHIECLAL
jgi:hypothetical protein